jgi:Protein of unknown function (DUF3168)
VSDPSLEMQAAIVAALKQGGALPLAVGGRVFDKVPTGAAFPYVSLGPVQVLPDKAGCIDGAEVIQQIDVWSREPGYPEAKRIAAAIVARLDDQPLNVDGHDAIVFEHVDTHYLRDPDGLTSHAVINFRSLIFPT